MAKTTKRKPSRSGSSTAKKKAPIVKAVTEDNPFVIEKGVILTGNRSGSSQLIQQLYERVIQLPVDREVSIQIPKSIAENAPSASNMVLGVRRLMRQEKAYAKWGIALKTFKDAKGNYQYSRVWRIA